MLIRVLLHGYMLSILATGFRCSARFLYQRTALRMYSRGDSTADKKHVLVPVANGTEEIEAVTVIDVLVRAGAEVCVASVEPTLSVTCSRGVKLTGDALIAETVGYNWDLIVFPGGMPGATNLRGSTLLMDLLTKHNAEGKKVAAICAAPAVVLSSMGLLGNVKATCYPAPKFRLTLPNESNEAIVVDGNFITSQGPGTAMAFAVKLVEVLFGSEKALAIANELLFK